MLANAHRVWAAQRGTADGFEAWRLAATGGASASRWIDSGRSMPEFSLQDMTGPAVRRADLSGKTVFISAWATWCGACQAESPYVQRRQERFKDTPDVVVLTFNIDENPGIVTQFMKQHGFHVPGGADARVRRGHDEGGVDSAELVGGRKGRAAAGAAGGAWTMWCRRLRVSGR